MSDRMDALRDELGALDTAVFERLRELEELLRSWHLGIPIPLGDDFVYAKCGNNLRFIRVSDGTPVTDTKRVDRAAFLAEWGTNWKLEQACETALRAAIDQRKEILP